MDSRTFIAALVGHLAWPLVTLALISLALFKLPKLARFIKAIRFKDFEVTIRDDFAQARAEAERLIIEQKQPVLPFHIDEKVLRLAEIDPSVAIIDVWRTLEQAIVKLIQHNGLMRFTTPAKFIEHLTTIGKLSHGDLMLFRKLRNIRDISVHADDRNTLSKGEVVEFSNFVALLIEKLEQIRQEPGYINVPRVSTAPGQG
jgi:hypothetical protein